MGRFSFRGRTCNTAASSLLNFDLRRQVLYSEHVATRPYCFTPSPTAPSYCSSQRRSVLVRVTSNLYFGYSGKFLGRAMLLPTIFEGAYDIGVEVNCALGLAATPETLGGGSRMLVRNIAFVVATVLALAFLVSLFAY
jgi:hypothetical protein